MISVAEVVEEEMGHDVGFVRLRDMFGCFFYCSLFFGRCFARSLWNRWIS